MCILGWLNFCNMHCMHTLVYMKNWSILWVLVNANLIQDYVMQSCTRTISLGLNQHFWFRFVPAQLRASPRDKAWSGEIEKREAQSVFNTKLISVVSIYRTRGYHCSRTRVRQYSWLWLWWSFFTIIFILFI